MSSQAACVPLVPGLLVWIGFAVVITAGVIVPALGLLWIELRAQLWARHRRRIAGYRRKP